MQIKGCKVILKNKVLTVLTCNNVRIKLLYYTVTVNAVQQNKIKHYTSFFCHYGNVVLKRYFVSEPGCKSDVFFNGDKNGCLR